MEPVQQEEPIITEPSAEMAVLRDIVLEITATRGLNSVLRTIVESASRLLRAPSGGLYLCDAVRRQLTAAVSLNHLRDYTGTVLRYGEGAAGTVAVSGNPLIIDDYRVWSDRASVYEADQPFSAVVCVPMLWNGAVTGVITIEDLAESRKFTLADQQLLAQLADHAAIALENARLYETLHEELAERRRAEETLRAANSLLQRVLSSLNEVVIITDPRSRIIEDCNRTFENVFGYCREEVTGKATSILHVDEAAFLAFRSFVAKHGAEADGASFEFAMKRKNGEVFPTEHYVTFVRDEAGRPVKSVSVIREITERLRADQREHALLERAIRQRAMQQSSWQAIRALAAGACLEETLGLIADLASEITQADMCTIQLIDPAGALVLKAVTGLHRDGLVGTTVAVDKAAPGVVLRTKAPFRTPDLQSELHHTLFPLAEEHVAEERVAEERVAEEQVAEEQGIRGFCSVPLLLRDEATGVLSVGTHAERDFTAEELEVLCAFADQAALAVERASLLAAQTEEAEVTRALLEATANTSGSLLDLPVLLAGLAASIKSVLGCDFCVISLDDDTGGGILPLYPQDIAQRILTTMESLGLAMRDVPGREQALGQRRLVAVEDAMNSELVPAALAAGVGARAILYVPIVYGERVLGLLTANFSNGPHVFSSKELAVAQGIANHAAIAIQNARLADDRHRLLLVEERQRIAREFHDSLGQDLAALLLKIELCREDATEGETDRLKARLESVRTVLEKQVREVRRSIFALRPIDIESHGLVPALRRLLDEFSRESGVKADLNLLGGEAHFPTPVERALFRLAQESVTNVRKHAQASSVSVELDTTAAGSVALTIRDDGRGFEWGQGSDSDPGSGLGLLLMAERVDRLHGSFRVHSVPGHGAVVKAVLPIEEVDGDDPHSGGRRPHDVPRGASRDAGTPVRL
jgi:PAS domain S-box-containing protein